MNASSPKIMVVDDDSASLYLMRKVLSADNFLDVEVDVFQDPEKAQASYNHEKNAPVIVLTANVEEGTENRALELGARKVFHKPFYIPDFIHEVKAALEASAVTSA